MWDEGGGQERDEERCTLLHREISVRIEREEEGMPSTTTTPALANASSAGGGHPHSATAVASRRRRTGKSARTTAEGVSHTLDTYSTPVRGAPIFGGLLLFNYTFGLICLLYMKPETTP